MCWGRDETLLGTLSLTKVQSTASRFLYFYICLTFKFLSLLHFITALPSPFFWFPQHIHFYLPLKLSLSLPRQPQLPLTTSIQFALKVNSFSLPQSPPFLDLSSSLTRSSRQPSSIGFDLTLTVCSSPNPI